MYRQRVRNIVREDWPVTRSSNNIEPLPELGAVGGELRDLANPSTAVQSVQQAIRGVQGYPRGQMELTVAGMSTIQVQELLYCQPSDVLTGRVVGQRSYTAGLRQVGVEAARLEIDAERYPIQETHHAGPVEHGCNCSIFQQHSINRSIPTEPPLTEGRVCNGTYIWHISDFDRLLQDAIDGKMTYSESPAIYTALYGYKFCMRIYPNGVNEGVGRCLALYVRMMQGEYDDNMVWPFRGKISISVLDVSGTEFRDHINGTFLAKPNLRSFLRPRAANTLNLYGYQEFAPIQLVYSPQYLKQDTLQVKIEISKH